MGLVVNDIHSALNETEVAEVVQVGSLSDVQDALARCRAAGRPVSVAGGRHAMGGQQFVTDGVLLDTRGLRRVLDLDSERGLVEVEAGIQWPELVGSLLRAQEGASAQWGIVQKQTGADDFTLGGSVSANVHGRGLTLPPIVSDVESLRLVRADGSVVECSRRENAELFALVVGGYGLFGVIYSVTLRLARRRKLERVVELLSVDQLEAAFEDRIAAGFRYGDFQFAIDLASPDFLHWGVFSCYRPTEVDTPIGEGQLALSRENWQELLWLAHGDKQRAFDEYTRHYLATSGQLYWSDIHQLAAYVPGYHAQLDRHGGGTSASEMIGEVYVPLGRLPDFMAAAAADCRRNEVDIIYGTVRLVEADDETVLAWARQRCAGIVLNVHTVHTQAGIESAAAAFRRLIDLALERDGSFFLTYHRWATDEQVHAAYPRFPEFVQSKRRHDPDGLFSSDWYRHYSAV